LRVKTMNLDFGLVMAHEFISGKGLLGRARLLPQVCSNSAFEIQ
jgi:hypothetical protein